MRQSPSSFLACLILSIVAPALSAQDGEAGPGNQKAPASSALADDAREALELIRWVLDQDDRDGARELLRETVDGLSRPEQGAEESHLAYLLALDRLALELGSPEVSLRLRERVLEIQTTLHPPDHYDVLSARSELAASKFALGDLVGARELCEVVYEARTRLLPPDHSDLLRAMGNLAVLRKVLGDLQGALKLEEKVTEAWTRLLPPDHPDLLRSKQNLATTRYALGDLVGARELEEAVVEAWTRLVPPDHPDFLVAQLNLAASRSEVGDHVGARELLEAVLEVRRRLLAPDHPDLLRVMENLAATRLQLGDLVGALELEEPVVETWARLFPPDHPDLLRAQLNLASLRRQLGDLEGALELEQAVVEVRAELLTPEHPDLLGAQVNLAATRYALGDTEGAGELFEGVLEAGASLLPPDHPYLLATKRNLAVTRYVLGDHEGGRDLLSSLLAGLRTRAGMLRAEAPRLAREGARVELNRLSEALSLGAGDDADPRLQEELFATIETLRLASAASAEAALAIASRPELAEEARAVAEIRSRLSDLVAEGPAVGGAAEDWRRELVQLTEERDRAQRSLRRKLTVDGGLADQIDAQSVGDRLERHSAAVSFLRYARRVDGVPSLDPAPSSFDALVAFVVRPGAELRRVELGPASEIERLIADWRLAMGQPVEGTRATFSGGGGPLGRGEPLDPVEERSDSEAGRALRQRVLDPILAVAGEDVTALHVVLDDVLFLAPLDALPLEGDRRVGDAVTVCIEPTLAQFVRARRPVPAGGALVAVGGVDYEAPPRELGDSEVERTARTSEPASTSSPERSGRPDRFEPLPGTRLEVEELAEQYARVFDVEPVTLMRAEATKTRLRELAPTTRFLHLATHGWFANESLRSQLDTLEESNASGAFRRAEEVLTGFAPETLCGLALAGANAGRDELGRVPGVLTAEELAGFDLRNCELAVLAACETNVGIRRAGQGIQSLQAALHVAGAHTSITSLWKVDDQATRRLFDLFYSLLWREGRGKAEALWRAKQVLRTEGYRPRDWAGWVLSGDPR